MDLILLIASVLIGGGLAFFVKSSYEATLKLMLSLTGAFILGICVLHLMPEVFTDPDINPGIFILLGFLIQLFLEQLTGGVEHGHLCQHDHDHKTMVVPILIGLSIHAFIEGLPMALIEGHQHDNYLWSILIHKAPAAFALGVLFRNTHISNWRIILYLLIFAIMSPLGAILPDIVNLPAEDIVKWKNICLSVVIGSFLHIATTILFEAEEKMHHKHSLNKLAAIFLGLGLALLTLL